jgi:rod shape determining protein RodA
MAAMPVVIEKPPLLQRLKPLVENFDWTLMGIVALLAAIGLVTMYSVAYEVPGRFEAHLRNMVLAAGVMLVVAHVPPQRLMTVAVPLYLVGVALLVAVALFGITKKGSTRWVNVGIVIQPSEIMKIAMPLMLAWWFQKREGALRTIDFVVAGVILAVPSALILTQPDLGTTLLVAASGLFVIYLAGLSWKLIIPPVVLGLAGIVTLIVMEPSWCQPGVDWVVLQDYQKTRVCTLLDPMKDPLGKGFHIIQGLIAIGSGGVWGKGMLQGTQTQLNFVPERTTDFIFAGFAEEFGFVGVVVLLIAFFVLIARGLKIANEAPMIFSRLLAGSLTLVYFTYAFVNMGMVSGILPVVGVPLPFLSYGGTAMVTLGASLGMLMSIARSKALVQS